MDGSKTMSARRARVISQEAFQKAFVETEIVMRKELARRIMIAFNDNVEDTSEKAQGRRDGLLEAKKIILGEEVPSES